MKKLWQQKTMSMMIEPEIGIPFSPADAYVDLKERALAACETAKVLSGHSGFDDAVLDVSALDAETAADMVRSYAEDPKAASKKLTETRITQLTPASLIMTGNILKEFGQVVVQDAVQIRHMVTNKLINETDHPDARVRLKALEMLGKISDVGLFSDKSEITVTHRSTEELRKSLRGKLEKLVQGEVVDGNFQAIDVQAELGLKTPREDMDG